LTSLTHEPSQRPVISQAGGGAADAFSHSWLKVEQLEVASASVKPQVVQIAKKRLATLPRMNWFITHNDVESWEKLERICGTGHLVDNDSIAGWGTTERIESVQVNLQVIAVCAPSQTSLLNPRKPLKVMRIALASSGSKLLAANMIGFAHLGWHES